MRRDGKGMTKKIEYTHKFEDGDSRIIDAVFYNEHTKLMFVRLKNQGIVVGYAEVPWATYDSFKHYGSRGTYWNAWVKGTFPGVDGDVTLVPSDCLIRKDYENQEWTSREEAIQPNPERSFTVLVHVEGVLEFNVNSVDALGAAKYVDGLMQKSLTDDGIAFIKEVKVVE